MRIRISSKQLPELAGHGEIEGHIEVNDKGTYFVVDNIKGRKAFA